MLNETYLKLYSLRAFGNPTSFLFLLLFTITFTIFIISFYIGWAVYVLNEIIVCKRMLRNLNHRSRSKETDELIYKYTGEFYKYILMLCILVLESLTFMPTIFATIFRSIGLKELSVLSQSEKNLFIVELPSNLFTFTFVLTYITIFLINTLTIHMTHFYRLEFPNEQFTPIKRKLLLLALFIHVLLILRLGITTQDIAQAIVQLICLAFIIYEYLSLMKNSKVLYLLLKWRYQDVFYEGDPSQSNFHKIVAQRYKHITLFLLISFAGIILIASSDAFRYVMIVFYSSYPQQLNHSATLRMLVLKWLSFSLTVCAAVPFYLFIVILTLYYLSASCCYKIGPMFGNRRVYSTLREPLLQ